eukprot:3780046-Rhodomonas_salina.2
MSLAGSRAVRSQMVNKAEDYLKSKGAFFEDIPDGDTPQEAFNPVRCSLLRVIVSMRGRIVLVHGWKASEGCVR